MLEDKIKQYYGTGEGDTKTATNNTKVGPILADVSLKRPLL